MEAKIQQISNDLIVPINPHFELFFVENPEKLKSYELYEFVNSIRNEKLVNSMFVAELLATYNPKNKKSVVGGLTVNVNRGALAVALKLPDTFVEAPDQAKMPPVNPNDDHASFLHKFVVSVMHSSSDTKKLEEIYRMREVIQKGHPQYFDFASFMWLLVEEELLQGLDIKTCYFARHMQCLIRSQHPELYEAGEVGGAHVKKKISTKKKTQPSKKRKSVPNESQAAEPSKKRSSRKKIVPEESQQGMSVNEPSKRRGSRKRKVPEPEMGVNVPTKRRSSRKKIVPEDPQRVVGSESQPEMGVVGSESQPRMGSLKRHPHKSTKNARNIQMSCLLSGDSSYLPVDDEYFKQRGSLAEEGPSREHNIDLLESRIPQEPPITKGKDTSEDTDNGLRDEMEAFLSEFTKKKPEVEEGVPT